jgi:hypothetical protein
MANRASSVFSRILLVFLVFATIGVGFYIGMTLLEPVAVPFSLPGKSLVKFDPRADVSKNAVFQTLRMIGPTEVLPGVLGRINPFVPVPPPVFSTSTAPATSTVETVATTTPTVVPTEPEPIVTPEPVPTSTTPEPDLPQPTP